jgi:hypothetical protein
MRLNLPFKFCSLIQKCRTRFAVMSALWLAEISMSIYLKQFPTDYKVSQTTLSFALDFRASLRPSVPCKI